MIGNCWLLTPLLLKTPTHTPSVRVTNRHWRYYRVMHPLDVLDKAVEAKILEDIYVLYNSEITAEKEYQHIEIRCF